MYTGNLNVYERDLSYSHADDPGNYVTKSVNKITRVILVSSTVKLVTASFANSTFDFVTHLSAVD